MQSQSSSNLFNVTVPSFKSKIMEKAIVFYDLTVSTRDGKTWNLDKRFSDFDALHGMLKKVYDDLPEIPGKTILSLSAQHEIESRRVKLEAYMQGLVSRKDIVNGDILRAFLQLDNAADLLIRSPKMLLDLPTSLGISQICYDQERGLLFLALSEMDTASRWEGYLTNMRLPWEEKVETETLATVGLVECYIQADKTVWSFDKVWSRGYPCQVHCLEWEARTQRLLVGGDDGRIEVLTVPKEAGYRTFIENFSLKAHTDTVTGAAMLDALIFSVSHDKFMKVIDSTSGKIINETHTGHNALESLAIDRDTKRAFVGTAGQTVLIYDITPVPANLLHIMPITGAGAVHGVDYLNKRNYLLTTSYDDGTIGIYDLEKPGKERFAKNLAAVRGRRHAQACCWAPSRNEFFVANENGTISFWNAKKIQEIYAMQAGTEEISALKWIENGSLVIAGGKDKRLKVWTLPAEWREKKFEDEEEIGGSPGKKGLDMGANEQKMPIGGGNVGNVQAPQRPPIDEDDDDLSGWQN